MSRLREFFDENLNYVGQQTSTESLQRADRLVRETLSKKRQPRIEYGANQHHSGFTRVKVDEALYAAGLLQRYELHRDCDLYDTFDLARAGEAMGLLTSRKATGKVVLTTGR